VGKRRKAREIVLQVLYESEFSERSAADILVEQFARRSSGDETEGYARALLDRVSENKASLDTSISEAAANWDLERISIIDRNILRFAMAEVLFFPDVPAKVIINEAIEIAHKFSSGDAGKFVNGILDRFVQEHRQDTT
jgi:N utilization substance protein B